MKAIVLILLVLSFRCLGQDSTNKQKASFEFVFMPDVSYRYLWSDDKAYYYYLKDLDNTQGPKNGISLQFNFVAPISKKWSITTFGRFISRNYYWDTFDVERTTTDKGYTWQITYIPVRRIIKKRFMEFGVGTKYRFRLEDDFFLDLGLSGVYSVQTSGIQYYEYINGVTENIPASFFGGIFDLTFVAEPKNKNNYFKFGPQVGLLSSQLDKSFYYIYSNDYYLGFTIGMGFKIDSND